MRASGSRSSRPGPSRNRSSPATSPRRARSSRTAWTACASRNAATPSRTPSSRSCAIPRCARAWEGRAARRPRGTHGTALWSAPRRPTASRSPTRAKGRRSACPRSPVRVLIIKKGVSTIGGSEAHARTLARTLAARGHDVTLVGARPPWPRAGLERAAEFRDGAARVLLLPPRLGRVGATLDALLPASLLDTRGLRERAGEVDVVHCVAREYAEAAERLARERGAAYVETPPVHPRPAFAGAGR